MRKSGYWGKFVGFLAPFRKKIILLMFLSALQTLCSLFMPYFMSSVVENGIRTTDMNNVYISCAVMCALAVGALAIALIYNRVSSKTASRFPIAIRRAVLEKVNAFSAEQFAKIGTGGLIARSTEDVNWVEDVLVTMPNILVSVPILLIGGTVLSLIKDRILPLILVCATVPALAFAVFIISKMDGLWEKSEKYVDEQNRIIRERFTGIRVIRAFDKDEYEHNRTRTATLNMCRSFIRANILGGIIQPIVGLLLNLATIAIIYVGAVRLNSGNALKVGDIVATVQYVALIVNAILMVSWTIGMLPRYKICIKRIFEILDTEVDEADLVSDGSTLTGNVKMSGVTFRYPDAQADALVDVNFTADAGETIAVIGGIGSGKTTLARLILGFYKPNDGQISLGGADYKDLTSGTVRENVAVALQRSSIFEGTLKENILMGNKQATDEEIERVTDVAQLSDFVASHKEGLLYELKQNGTNISGGQKQRVNIARTLLKSASVYIFDDSFSALDYLTESKLRSELAVYLKGKTQIIVTQRAATAMKCDKIYVMDGGRIVGCGTHGELLESSRVYREIYLSQLGGN